MDARRRRRRTAKRTFLLLGCCCCFSCVVANCFASFPLNLPSSSSSFAGKNCLFARLLLPLSFSLFLPTVKVRERERERDCWPRHCSFWPAFSLSSLEQQRSLISKLWGSTLSNNELWWWWWWWWWCLWYILIHSHTAPLAFLCKITIAKKCKY